MSLSDGIPADRRSYFTSFDHPGVALEHKERSETLFRAIHQLPTDQKTAYTLAKVEGFSYKEVSEIMKKSVSSIESLLFRARKNLEKTLRDFYKNDV